MSLESDITYLAELQASLKQLKEKEMDLRLKVHQQVNKGRGPGTYRDDFGGVRLKSVIRYNYTIDEEELSQVWDDMDDNERECIRFKPSLNKKQYDSMGHGNNPLVDGCLIVKPGTPAITVEDNYE